MNCCMQKDLDFLNLLSETDPIQQRALLQTAICECIYRSMHGDIPMPQGIKEELIPKKQVLCDLADTKVPYKTKKNLLLQSGGSILEPLLPPAISAILGLSIIQRNNGHI